MASIQGNPFALWILAAIMLLGGRTLGQAPCPPREGDYRIGVVMFHHSNNLTRMGFMLDSVVTLVAGGDAQRDSGNLHVQLLVQLEVPWAETESMPGVFDFDWYKGFAKLCEDRGIRWCPLLSPHYVPNWAAARYAADSIRDHNGVATPNYSMPFSPSSQIWRQEVGIWAREFLQAMRFDTARNHLGAGGAIEEILVGNEMIYPDGGSLGFVVTTFDSVTQVAWNNQYPPPMQTSGPQFLAFRSQELSLMLVDLVSGVRNQLALLGVSNLPVGTKTYPYYFLRSGMIYKDTLRGYSAACLQAIDSVSDFMAVNCIPKPDSGGTCVNFWTMRNDYLATRAVTNKSIFVAEYNVDPACGIALPHDQLLHNLLLGIDSFGVERFTFFAWNPWDAAFRMQPSQMAAVRAAMDCLIPAVVGVQEDVDMDGVTLEVFPIPAMDHVQVALKGAAGPANLQLLNDHGQVVYSGHYLLGGTHDCRIPLSGLSPGLYQLIVRMDHRVACKKVLKLG